MYQSLMLHPGSPTWWLEGGRGILSLSLPLGLFCFETWALHKFLVSTPDLALQFKMMFKLIH